MKGSVRTGFNPVGEVMKPCGLGHPVPTEAVSKAETAIFSGKNSRKRKIVSISSSICFKVVRSGAIFYIP